MKKILLIIAFIFIYQLSEAQSYAQKIKDEDFIVIGKNDLIINNLKGKIKSVTEIEYNLMEKYTDITHKKNST